jgi:hypothetical protein
MSVTPAVVFGLKADNPGVLTTERILIATPPIRNPRAQID